MNLIGRAIHKGLKEFAFPRPLLDVSNKTWAKFFDKALGKELKPPFDPYCNSLNYVLSAYMIPYVGLTGYVGTSPLLFGKEAKKVPKCTINLNILLYLYQSATSKVCNTTNSRFGFQLMKVGNVQMVNG